MGEEAEGGVAASVVCLRMPDFAPQPVAEQLVLKEKLAAAVGKAVDAVAADDRIVLDTPEGVAIVWLGEPEQALAIARSARDHALTAALPLAAAVSFGAVELADRAGGHPNIVGDGIAGAEELVTLAHSGEILASRPFREALAVTSRGAAMMFRHLGARTDQHLRAHEVYAVESDARLVAKRRRRVLAGAAAAAVLIIASGIAIRSVKDEMERNRRPATVVLAITPSAEVSVDGVSRGRTPPLTAMEVVAGRHTVMIRHAAYAPLTLELDLKPGEQTTISHAFPVIKARAPAPKPTVVATKQSSPFREFLRKLGGG